MPQKGINMFFKKINSYEYATQDWRHFWVNRTWSVLTDTLWAFAFIGIFFIVMMVVPVSEMFS